MRVRDENESFTSSNYSFAYVSSTCDVELHFLNLTLPENENWGFDGTSILENSRRAFPYSLL